MRNPLTSAILLFIRVYQQAISPLLGPRCRFHPTCSCYAADAIGRYGVVKGGALSLRRLAKCHPLNPGGYDPIPDSPPADTRHG
jgi:putative membrane protein insertion efficiency factor